MINLRFVANAVPACALLCSAAFAQAQPQTPAPVTDSTTASAAASADIPRLPDGHPDFQGLWHYVGVTPGGRGGRGRANVPGGGGAVPAGADPAADYQPREGVPRPYPYLPVAEQVKEFRAVGEAYDDPEAHCHLPGVPREMEQPTALFPFQVIQDEQNIAFLYEYVHDVRVIPEDNSAHPKNYWAWDGDSRGHWEGDTFVVDVTNFNGRSWLDMMGNFVDENEHVVERYKMLDANTMLYSATVEDPSVFAKSCHEGEQDVNHYPPSEGNHKK